MAVLITLMLVNWMWLPMSNRLLVIDSDPRESTFAFKELMKAFINIAFAGTRIIGYIIGKGIILDSKVFVRKQLIWTHAAIQRNPKLLYSQFIHVIFNRKSILELCASQIAQQTESFTRSHTQWEELMDTLGTVFKSINEYYIVYSPIYHWFYWLFRKDIPVAFIKLIQFNRELRAWIWIQTKKGLEK